MIKCLNEKKKIKIPPGKYLCTVLDVDVEGENNMFLLFKFRVRKGVFKGQILTIKQPTLPLLQSLEGSKIDDLAELIGGLCVVRILNSEIFKGMAFITFKKGDK